MTNETIIQQYTDIIKAILENTIDTSKYTIVSITLFRQDLITNSHHRKLLFVRTKGSRETRVLQHSTSVSMSNNPNNVLDTYIIVTGKITNTETSNNTDTVPTLLQNTLSTQSIDLIDAIVTLLQDNVNQLIDTLRTNNNFKEVSSSSSNNTNTTTSTTAETLSVSPSIHTFCKDLVQIVVTDALYTDTTTVNTTTGSISTSTTTTTAIGSTEHQQPNDEHKKHSSRSSTSVIVIIGCTLLIITIIVVYVGYRYIRSKPFAGVAKIETKEDCDSDDDSSTDEFYIGDNSDNIVNYYSFDNNTGGHHHNINNVIHNNSNRYECYRGQELDSYIISTTITNTNTNQTSIIVDINSHSSQQQFKKDCVDDNLDLVLNNADNICNMDAKKDNCIIDNGGGFSNVNVTTKNNTDSLLESEEFDVSLYQSLDNNEDYSIANSYSYSTGNKSNSSYDKIIADYNVSTVTTKQEKNVHVSKTSSGVSTIVPVTGNLIEDLNQEQGTVTTTATRATTIRADPVDVPLAVTTFNRHISSQTSTSSLFIESQHDNDDDENNSYISATQVYTPTGDVHVADDGTANNDTSCRFDRNDVNRHKQPPENLTSTSVHKFSSATTTTSVAAAATAAASYEMFNVFNNSNSTGVTMFYDDYNDYDHCDDDDNNYDDGNEMNGTISIAGKN